jgi:hypothetical protein
MKDGIYFEVEGLEKALMKLERLAEIDRKKARQFKAGIKKAAKPMVTAVKASIKNSNQNDKGKKVRKGYLSTGTVQTKMSKDPAKRKFKEVTYKPGNLKRSIGFFPSRKKGALLGYVGARMGKRAGKTFDGYYAAIVNYGLGRGKAKANPKKKRNINYAEKGFKKAAAQTQAQLLREVQKILKQSLYQLSR